MLHTQYAMLRMDGVARHKHLNAPKRRDCTLSILVRRIHERWKKDAFERLFLFQCNIFVAGCPLYYEGVFTGRLYEEIRF